MVDDNILGIEKNYNRANSTKEYYVPSLYRMKTKHKNFNILYSADIDGNFPCHFLIEQQRTKQLRQAKSRIAKTIFYLLYLNC